MSEVYYFGCLREAGHYLWINEGYHAYDYRKYGLTDRLVYALDGAFCPFRIEYQRWLCSIVPPWTIVSWWDSSQDTRPQSVSAFIGSGFGNEPHRLLDAARTKFPSVFARQPKELIEYEPTKA